MLSIVYPVNGHQSFEASTFLMGQGPAGSVIKVSDLVFNTSKNGFFSGKVDLKPGQNHFSLQAINPKAIAKTSAVLATAQLKVIRNVYQPVKKVQLLSPKQPMGLMGGDSFLVEVLVPDDKSYTVFISGMTDNPLPLKKLDTTEPFVDKRQLIFGEPHWIETPIPTEVYRFAEIKIPALVKSNPVGQVSEDGRELIHRAIEIRDEGTGQTVLASSGLISIWQQPRWAQVNGVDSAILRETPDDYGKRLSPQLPNTIVEGLGEEKGYLKINLGSNNAGWILQNQLSWIAPPESVSDKLESIDVESKVAGRVKINFKGPHLKLIQPINAEVTNKKITLAFTGIQADSNLVIKQIKKTFVSAVNYHQLSPDLLLVTVELNSALSGYQVNFNSDGVALGLKSLAATLKSQPVETTKILLDPGHGGAELGSVGLDGVPEKTVNLVLALKVKEAFNQAGFTHVALTRQRDTAVALMARQKQAEEWDADICLSLHHNALPDGRDPQDHQGLCTFYYHSFSEALAQHLEKELTQSLERPAYGVFKQSFVMTRIASCLSVLIEFGFFTHPEEFEIIRTENFQTKAAMALVESVKEYLNIACRQ